VKASVIRCGTPDCDWGYRVSDLSEEQLELCYSEFRKHCIQGHDLQEWDTTSYMRLDLELWTLTLSRHRLLDTLTPEPNCPSSGVPCL